MGFQAWVKLFIEQLLQTKLLELTAVAFGIAEVLFAKKNHIWLYPTGIISIVLSMFLLYEAKLYAEMLLSIYYLVMSVYGWVIWKKKSIKEAKQITYTTQTEMITALLISGVGFVLLYMVLSKYTNSDVPYMDAFVSSVAWAGMWLLAKRKIENWIFLNISNLVAIPLLIHKHLAMMAVLTIILFTVAIFGYFDWKNRYRTASKSPSL